MTTIKKTAGKSYSSPSRMCRMFPLALELPLARAASPVFKKRGFAQHRIITHWEEIAGERIARNSVPVKLSFPAGKHENGCLTVKVWNGVSLDLQYSEPQLLEKLAIYFGYRAVSRIRILQAPLTTSDNNS